MKRSIFIFVFVGFSLCTFGQKINMADLKEEALNFSLEVVRNYFLLDCNKDYEMHSDTVMAMDGDGFFIISEHKEKMCKSLNKAIKNKDKSYSDYLECYETQIILTPKEMEKRAKRKLPKYFKTCKGDFFFIGGELKTPLKGTEDFVWDDMFLFMVRKINGVWKIKGISG